MSVELTKRSQNKCELCESKTELASFAVEDQYKAYLCVTCRLQLDGSMPLDSNHWKALSNTMWSEFPGVQILVYRVLSFFKNQTWSSELLEQLYLEDSVLELAQKKTLESSTPSEKVFDSNGNELLKGDSVTLIKDLDVKGAGFTAKRGTIVRGISLTDDPGNIQGRVNGVQIILKTEFLKKV